MQLYYYKLFDMPSPCCSKSNIDEQTYMERDMKTYIIEYIDIKMYI